VRKTSYVYLRTNTKQTQLRSKNGLSNGKMAFNTTKKNDCNLNHTKQRNKEKVTPDLSQVAL